MNRDTVKRNERLADMLAAEYVLGTLRGGARRRFEQWLRVDAVLMQIVHRWNDRLQPMGEWNAAVDPPARVWDGIERRLPGRAEAVRNTPSLWQQINRSLAFWRAMGVGASVLAVALVLGLLLRQPAVTSGAANSYVATLGGDKTPLVLAVSGDVARRTLTIRAVATLDVAKDKSLELWAVPSQGAPVSLGLVSADSPVTVTLPAGVSPESMPLLAVSLEPKGGSPNKHAPSGPILYKGAWARI
jgi:anti-sigma-K factor RskA